MFELFIGAVVAGVAIYLVTTIGITAIQIVMLCGCSYLLGAGLGLSAYGLNKILSKHLEKQQDTYKRIKFNTVHERVEDQYTQPQSSSHSKNPFQHKPKSIRIR